MITLQFGSTGSEVRKLQSALNRAGYSLVIDGIFGSETTRIVKAFQKWNDLVQDGIVGDLTWSKLAPYMINLEELGQALMDTLNEIEKLPSYKKIMEMIDNV